MTWLTRQLWHLCDSDRAGLYGYRQMSQKNSGILSDVEAAITKGYLWQ